MTLAAFDGINPHEIDLRYSLEARTQLCILVQRIIDSTPKPVFIPLIKELEDAREQS